MNREERVQTDRGDEATAERAPGDVEEVLERLLELEGSVESEEHRREIQRARRGLGHLPGGDRIQKYTPRDVGEALVGSIIFALPLLVEDGVFVIAEHFLDRAVAGVPLLLVGNLAFVVVLTAGLLYAVDFLEVGITNPIFGVVPRRLVGVLGVSFLAAAGLMLLWGRLFAEGATTPEAFARVTVVWAAAALGASLGDILPGESKGTDLTLDNLDDLVDGR